MSTDREKTADDSPGASDFPLERREFVASMFTAAAAFAVGAPADVISGIEPVEASAESEPAEEQQEYSMHAFGAIFPVNAGVPDIDIVFVDERDTIVNPLGVKGIGEIGTVGVAAAVANAVYNATGVRVRDLPITLDKVLRVRA